MDILKQSVPSISFTRHKFYPEGIVFIVPVAGMIISPDFRTTTMSQHRANGNSYSSAGELSEKSSSNDADSRSVQRRVVRERDASAPVRRSTSSMSPIETLHIVLEVCTSLVRT